MKNYIDLGPAFPGTWEHYVYLDTDEFLAKSLFLRHLIHVRVAGVMEREDEEYKLVDLKVRKRDEKLFLRAMEELKGKMLLFGHSDYDSHGGELMDRTRDLIRHDAAETGLVKLPTGGRIRAGTLPEM
jgi:hypothetical protein